MGNCCGNGTLPHGRIRRQESSALRESRRIKHKQQTFVRTLLEKDEAKVDLTSPPPGKVGWLKRYMLQNKKNWVYLSNYRIWHKMEQNYYTVRT